MINLRMRKPIASSLFVIASIFSIPAIAAPLSLEGPIDSVVDNGDGSATMTVMGIVVSVPSGTPISSPTAVLNASQLANQTPLPGRPQPGFVGGTAIITGEALGGVNTADDVFVEPSENIIGGECGGFGCASISGVPVVQLTDSRIMAGPVVNGNGLQVSVTQILEGSPAAAEGYYGTAANGVKTFYYFLMEAEGPLLAANSAYEISITRARCRDDDNIRILGGISATQGVVHIEGDINEDVQIVVDEFGQGTYSYRDDISGNCPATVTVSYTDNSGSAPAMATADTEIR
jgi:hypothetical protein